MTDFLTESTHVSDTSGPPHSNSIFHMLEAILRLIVLIVAGCSVSRARNWYARLKWFVLGGLLLAVSAIPIVFWMVKRAEPLSPPIMGGLPEQTLHGGGGGGGGGGVDKETADTAALLLG